ncbi:maltodextrin glycosyltransferase [Amedibacillus sp. YH-ame10]
MKNLQLMIDTLHHEEALHKQDTYNYVIPESWNHFGFRYVRKLRNKQLIVNPYSFYAYTLDQMFKGKGELCSTVSTEDSSWLSKASVYSLMIRCATSWDHDRDDYISNDNLYHLSDNGTFLKSIALLPLLKRMGIDTILLHQPFALGKTQKAHDYACKEAVVDFQKIDEQLGDPILKSMSVEAQFAAFVEASHVLGMKVIVEYCPAKMARNNAYIAKHPDWFYWIEESYEKDYHAPICHSLPQNTLPFSYTLKDLYKSDDVIQHIAHFHNLNKGDKASSLEELQTKHNVVCAPSIVDQINANVIADVDTTILRFYEDDFVMMQDRIRPDLYPGKKAIRTCWNQLNRNITWLQTTFHIDGIYLEKPYLLPEKLQVEFVQTARKFNPHFVMIAEETQSAQSEAWIKKGYDMISGKSGYEESNIWEYKFHNFAYQAKGNACPMFAAAEFYDARRISCLENGKQLAITLTIMNHFLPNTIPMMLNGIESYDVQPLQLSEYGDQAYTYSLPKEDDRYRRQPYLDHYYFNYLSDDLSILPNLLEKITKIRKAYLDVICNAQYAIPVWFDSPKDLGIGFTFLKEDKALMVVCNVHVHTGNVLHIHTDNIFPEFAFNVEHVQQIFSTCDPYVHDIDLDALGNLPLSFEPGEVKFIEFK